jgi:methionine synthase II (cobalamin-independent)
VKVGYSGLGSLPGTDFAAAVRMTFDKVPELPYLPELPARGPWAAMIGRGLGLPSGLPADYQAGEWRLGVSGIDQRRSRAVWREDLDLLEEQTQGFEGRFKVAVTGPWTLAANLGVAHAGRVLADAGARRDVAQSLAESVAELLADVAKRIPGAALVLQIDEPSLPAVAAGSVPTPGGFFRHRAVDLPEIVTALRKVADAAGVRATEVVLHSCAPWSGPGSAWPLADLLNPHGAGLSGISLDVDQLSGADLSALGEAADGGAGLYLGMLPTTLPVLGMDQLTSRSLKLVERLGIPSARQLVLTPACGLSRWSFAEVSTGLVALRTVATRVTEELYAD